MKRQLTPGDFEAWAAWDAAIAREQVSALLGRFSRGDEVLSLDGPMPLSRVAVAAVADGSRTGWADAIAATAAKALAHGAEIQAREEAVGASVARAKAAWVGASVAPLLQLQNEAGAAWVAAVGAPHTEPAGLSIGGACPASLAAWLRCTCARAERIALAGAELDRIVDLIRRERES